MPVYKSYYYYYYYLRWASVSKATSNWSVNQEIETEAQA